ncbi:MAG: hypothetical protein D6687_01455 [Acidobacteria bacterium]|nr:MAG: hypothetical protein D6687_01455 [Acidobacteriota bacterium]
MIASGERNFSALQKISEKGRVKSLMATKNESLGGNNRYFHQRIMAHLPVKASWVDKVTGKRIEVEGLTEHIGEKSALVNLNTLPPVGGEISLRVLDEDKTLIEVPAEVIRVERDPSKPLAALSIVENIKKWKSIAMTAAQEWVARQWKLNYEEEWAN